MICDGTPSSFWSATLRVNVSTSVSRGEHEQVADLLEVDLPARPPREVLNASRLRLAISMLSASENCARSPACGLRGRPAGQLVALEQHDLRTGLGEVERGADADDAPADDHDIGTGRQRGATHASWVA